MKKIMILLAAATYFAGCGKTDDIDAATAVQHIELSTEKIVFDKTGNVMVYSDHSVVVTSSAEWRLVGNASWCIPSAVGGHSAATVTFAALPNETDEVRETTLVFICGNVSKELVVSQLPEGRVEYMNEVKDAYEFGAEGGSIFIRLNSNLDANELAMSQAWITLPRPGATTSGEQWIQIVVEPNPEFSDRTGTVTLFPGTEIEREITIDQEAYSGVRTDSPTEYQFGPEGDTVTIVATGDADFTIESEYGDWITLEEISSREVDGLFEKTLRIVCAAGDFNRRGTVELIPQSGTGVEIRFTQTTPNPPLFEIPDEDFAYYLASSDYVIDRGEGKYELTSDGYALTELELDWMDTESLKGIEQFVNLRSLSLSSLPLRVVDLSGNTKLEELNIYSIPLAELTLGDANITELALYTLNYWDAEPAGADSLTVSSNKLKVLEINEDSSWEPDYIEVINVVNCPALTELECVRLPGVLKRVYIAKDQQIEIQATEGAEIIEVTP